LVNYEIVKIAKPGNACFLTVQEIHS